jgi:hypothetical protein
MAAILIGNYKKQKVSVSNLQLDLENFRTGPATDQNAAIFAMIRKSANKLKGLTTSISENGFLDLEIPCVFPSPKDDGKFIVAEGNRRVSALKILKTPALAKNTALMADVKKLNAKSTQKLPSQIECAVFGNKKDCLAYILMRHGYSTEGAGVIQWNTISKLRADSYVNNKLHQQLVVLDFVVTKGNLTPDRIQIIDDDELNITNLQRLTADPKVRERLKIVGTDCSESTKGEIWLLAVWQRIIEVIIDGKHKGEKFTVDNNINTTIDRQSFVDEIIFEVQSEYGCSDDGSLTNEKTDKTTTESKDAPTAASATQGDSEENSSPNNLGNGALQGKKVQTTQSRKYLIPDSFKPANLAPQRAVNICSELGKLNVNIYPNCVGAMFRVFLEFSVDNFISKTPAIETSCKKSPNSKIKDRVLSVKIRAVMEYFEASHILTHKELKPVRDILSQQGHHVSTESLNAYVHNVYVSPKPEALKTEWDNLQHFIALLWPN